MKIKCLSSILLLSLGLFTAQAATTPQTTDLSALDAGSLYSNVLAHSETITQSFTTNADGSLKELRIASYNLGPIRLERTLKPGKAAAKFTVVEEKAMMADHFEVLLRPGVPASALDAFVKGHSGLRAEPVIAEWQMYRILLASTSDADFQAGFATLTAEKDLFEVVEPSYIYVATGSPSAAGIAYNPPPANVRTFSAGNDQFAGYHFDLNIVSAPAAWSVINDASPVVVAVLDTGIYGAHQDLQPNMWQNPNGQGQRSDHFEGPNGANYVNKTVAPNDDAASSHGTHVAGIVGAVGNNGVGITGTAWSVKLMAVKVLDSNGSGNNDTIAAGINYAAANGARVINLSLGGPGYSATMKNAIHNVGVNYGAICVCAAGNANPNAGHPAPYNLDSEPIYPASYGASDPSHQNNAAETNVISVLATSRSEDLATYSDYGGSTVLLGAPGGDGDSYRDQYGNPVNWILSTKNDGNYFWDSGTSMAAPRVAGTVALLKARFTNDNVTQTVARLTNSVDQLPSLNGKCTTGGRLDMLRSMSVWSKYSQPANAGGWRYVPWFDWINDTNYPNCNHLTLGFFWVTPGSGNGTDNLYLYIYSFGQFFYTNESLGSDAYGIYLYRFSDDAWLYYFKGSNNPKTLDLIGCSQGQPVLLEARA